MSERTTAIPSRLLDLLADRATQPLPEADRSEYRRLLDAQESIDEQMLDWTAALLDRAIDDPVTPMPAHLRARVEADAVRWLAREHGLQTVGDAGPPAVTVPRPERQPRWRWAPWLVAAASIVIAVLAWIAVPARVEPGFSPEAVLAAADVRHIPLDDNTKGLDGEIVWSQSRQQGYLRISGLPVNDPSRDQYQLWIADGGRAGEEASRIDGGVFDAGAGTPDVLVPIRAALPVDAPTFFAVTRERPGGVIVSDLTGLMVTATVKS